MKKMLILMAVTLPLASSVGCGCCRRLSYWFNRGDYCGPAAAAPAFASPLGFAAPQPRMVAPAQVVGGCDPCCSAPAEACCESCGSPFSEGVIYDSGPSSGCQGCNTGFGGGTIIDGGTIISPPVEAIAPSPGIAPPIQTIDPGPATE